jgi:hypothetical protein
MYWDEKPIVNASSALEIFMHSLPCGSRFNICKFGSNHQFLFPESSVAYNEDTLCAAISDIQRYPNEE